MSMSSTSFPGIVDPVASSVGAPKAIEKKPVTTDKAPPPPARMEPQSGPRQFKW